MTHVSETEPVLWLTEQDVVQLVDLRDSIDALEVALLAEHRSEAFSVRKALGTWGERSSSHALGAVWEGEGLACFKTWVNTPRGAAAILSLFDAEKGRLLATIEAGAIGALRTAAISGVATRWLADESARTMAVIGTGRQALQQVAAVHLVRPLEEVQAYSPTEEHRVAFVRRVTEDLGIPAVAATSVQAAIADQPIVTLISRAREPFVAAANFAGGSHVNAVGAILPVNAELLPDVLERASLIVVDSLENAQSASRELREHLGDSPEAWQRVTPLNAILGVSVPRATDADLTVFKGMGMGLSDLAVAGLAYQRAREAGIGLELSHPVPAAPRWAGSSA